MHWSSRLAMLYLGLCLLAIAWAPLRRESVELRWQTVQGLTLPGSLLAGSGSGLALWGDAALALAFAVVAGLNALLLICVLRGIAALISRLERLDETGTDEGQSRDASSR